MSAAFSTVTGWTLFAGIVLTTGAVAARWLVLPKAFRNPHLGTESGSADEAALDEALRRTADFATFSSVLLVAGVALYFVRQLLEFRDPFVPWGEEATLLLTGTPWGASWLWAAAGSLAATIAFLMARAKKPIGWWVATPIVLALGTFPGRTGHAAAADLFAPFPLLADAVHVWAAGAWIGGLAVVLSLELGGRGGERVEGTTLARLVPAFSPVAMGSVGALVLTGLFASWSQLADVGALLSTPYGRTLLLKLVLVAAVLAMGARNFRVLTPRLGNEDGDAAMRRSAWIELVLAEVVLVVTAVLVRTSPSDH